MPKNYKSILCQCSECITNRFFDDSGKECCGAYQRPQVAQKHRQRDFLRTEQERDRSEAEDVLEENIVLAALFSDDETDSELPVRSRDRDDASIPQQEVDSMDTSPDGPTDLQDCALEDKQELLRTISALQSSLHHKTKRLPTAISLVFATDPKSLEDLPGPLLTSHPDNAEMLATEDWLQGNSRFLDLHELPHDRDLLGRMAALKRSLNELTKKIEKIKSLAWERAKVNVGLYGVHSVYSAPLQRTDRWFKAREFRHPFLLAALLLAIVLHALATVSRPETTYLLATLKVVIYGAFMYDSTASRTALTPAQRSLLNGVPLDIRTLLKHLDLEPERALYACCPRCFALYPPDHSSPQDPYPRICTHRPTPSDPQCGRELVSKQKGGAWTPIKTFAFQSLHAWLGQLLSRPGIEPLLEKAWTPSSKDGPDAWTDILAAPAIQQFLGPDGRTLFSCQPNGSIHLVFSLFVDWFNPFGNKKGGKSHAVGAIYMACLNLPPEQRYRTENIYLAGIIPGPGEPSLEQINHFLRPLVDQLLTLWHTGIYLERTASRKTGRLIRAAMIPLVCDLPALRKVSGFAGHSSGQHFCSFCSLKKANIANLDRSTWHRRSWKEHMDIAVQWRDANSSQEREDIFEEHGLRWSELLRLPYWDPTRYALVDAMHNLYLGELRHHCMRVLGIDVTDKSPDDSSRPAHTPEEQSLWLTKAVSAIQRRSANALQSIRKGYIVAIADCNGVVPKGTKFVKKTYIEALLEWAETHMGDILVPPVLEEATRDFHTEKPQDLSQMHLLDPEILLEIRKDIKNTFLPSWVQPAPSNFGNPTHGKLKAAQWRTVCTVNMVITLVRVWGTLGTPRATKRNRQLLNNFIDLVLAVDYATRRSMSPSRAADFDAHMLRYQQDLLRIFEHKLVPNHHMSLHLRECLDLFGPVHAWWAFPFERYNGLIAQLKTNNKASDMPLTFLRYFCIGSSLRWIMSTIDWPKQPYFEDMIQAYTIAFGRTLRGIFTGSSSTAAQFSYNKDAEVRLDRATYDALFAKVTADTSAYSSCFVQMPGAYGSTIYDRAQFVPQVTVASTGLVFGTGSKSQRNSYILFKRDETEAPAQIDKIFYHKRHDPSINGLVIEPFFLIKPFIPLDDAHAAKDPYRRFQGLNTMLYYSDTETDPVLLRQSDIISHFAALRYVPPGIDEECIVVRSLDRE